jgi:toxin FitB
MFLLDTNAISDLRKIRRGTANKGLVQWASAVAASDLYLSVVTIEEIEIGVLLALRRDQAKGTLLKAWLATQVIPAFANRILSVDLAVVRRSAQLHVPDRRPVRDALIAATALVHGMTVVTRNVVDFAPMAVPTLNPWLTATP